MDSVCVLMSTYNGERYLQTQIDSLLNQKEIDLLILVRDDGSTDGTKKVLEDYSERGKLRWYQGENVGPAKSFMDLIYNAPEADYYAFCDQDDYWKENKLKIAINKIKEKVPKETECALYYSRVVPVDQNLEIIDYQDLEPKVDGYAELIVNYAYGCTIVFNKKLFGMLQRKPYYIPMHDWWAVIVCFAVGGVVIYDDDSYILYRQHGNNTLGMDETTIGRLKRRIFKVFIGNEKRRSRMVKELLRLYQEEIASAEYLSTLKLLTDCESGLKNKVRVLENNKLRSGSFGSDWTFRISVLLNKY